MSTPTLEAALARIRTRAEHDQDLAEAVRFLAADEVRDPWEVPKGSLLGAAKAVNRRRHERQMLDFVSRAMTTAEVVSQVASISDRRAVDRRRKRGTLLGVRFGNRTLHPNWQFDRRRGDTYKGLGPLLSTLKEVTKDPLAADALVTAPRPDLDGRSIAEIFADGHTDLAVRIVRMAGDQS